MKFLTLNTHSWLEIHQLHKIKVLANFIVDEAIDVVALQEINQSFVARVVEPNASYIPATGFDLKADNFALLLMEFIEQRTSDYRWSWVEAHQGWERYDEGLAILSRLPVRSVHQLELSESHYTYSDVFRRCALVCEVEHEGQSLWVASVHMNWWLMQDVHLFEHDFASLDRQIRELAAGSPIVLLGDFNNDASVDDEGYQQIVDAGWLDAFTSASLAEGEFTVHKKIAGWEDATCEMRIDYAFLSQPADVQKYTVVFPDNTDQAISDHSGIVVEIEDSSFFPAT